MAWRNKVLENLDAFFAANFRPAYLKEADWAAARMEAAMRSLWLLSVIALNRKDYPTEEAELLKYLELAPKDANAALMLSRAIIAQRSQTRYPEAIFRAARAGTEVTFQSEFNRSVTVGARS